MALWRLRMAVLLLGAGAASGGCAAAGLAAGPLMSAVHAIGDRAVERTVPADLHATGAAVEAVLLGGGIRVEERSRDGDGLRLRGATDRVTVHARLEPVTARMTRLSLRIETGGLVADRTTSEHLHDQVMLALRGAVPPAAAGDDRGHVAALAALEAELHRLRSTIDAERSSRPGPGVAREAPGTPPPAAPFSVDPSGVVSIPTSYGLPTLGRPAPAPRVDPPAMPAAAVATGGAPRAVTPEREASADAGAMAPALRPAGALTPVGAITGAGRAH